jgi:hypothetical protein
MKRRYLLLLLLVPLVIGVLVYFCLKPRGSGITAENGQRIAKGMTAVDVERIFGCPPGVYGGPYWIGALNYREPLEPHTTLKWEGDSVHFLVFFDSNGQVISSASYSVIADPRSRWRRAWDWVTAFM